MKRAVLMTILAMSLSLGSSWAKTERFIRHLRDPVGIVGGPAFCRSRRTRHGLCAVYRMWPSIRDIAAPVLFQRTAVGPPAEPTTTVSARLSFTSPV
jgi:hypothetical protein